MTETNGHWGAASEPPLPQNATGAVGAQSARMSSVTCTHVGDCVAVGTSIDDTNVNSQAMFLSETHGVWGQPALLTLPAARRLPPGASSLP